MRAVLIEVRRQVTQPCRGAAQQERMHADESLQGMLQACQEELRVTEKVCRRGREVAWSSGQEDAPWGPAQGLPPLPAHLFKGDGPEPAALLLALLLVAAWAWATPNRWHRHNAAPVEPKQLKQPPRGRFLVGGCAAAAEPSREEVACTRGAIVDVPRTW